jgi:hypothetical protein
MSGFYGEWRISPHEAAQPGGADRRPKSVSGRKEQDRKFAMDHKRCLQSVDIRFALVLRLNETGSPVGIAQEARRRRRA